MRMREGDPPCWTFLLGINPAAVVTTSFFMREGKYQFRHLGEVSASKPGRNDRITLGSCRFQPGDYLCVVIRERDN